MPPAELTDTNGKAIHPVQAARATAVAAEAAATNVKLTDRQQGKIAARGHQSQSARLSTAAASSDEFVCDPCSSRGTSSSRSSTSSSNTNGTGKGLPHLLQNEAIGARD